MFTTAIRPKPATPADWDSAITPHIGHDLIVHSGYSRNRVVVHCTPYDGRASLTVWGDTYPAPVPEDGSGDFRAQILLPLFFGARSVGCRTCQTPVAR